jgi:hypothetical protein
MSVLNIKLDKPTCEVKVPQNAVGLMIPLFSFHAGSEGQHIIMHSPEIGCILSATADCHKGITIGTKLEFEANNFRVLHFEVRSLDGKPLSKDGHLLVHYHWITEDQIEEPHDLDADDDYFQVKKSTDEYKSNHGSKGKTN